MGPGAMSPQAPDVSLTCCDSQIPLCQAVECRVAGIEPVTDSWTEEWSIAVKQLVAGKSLTVTVVDVQESGRLHSVDVLLSPIGNV